MNDLVWQLIFMMGVNFKKTVNRMTCYIRSLWQRLLVKYNEVFLCGHKVP